ncbi:methyltransferase [Nonomuraea sp. NPDC046802]|uniref:methyltransferase n=1 Tax=Nonomuraea sp. NPDC046802 TaxID=3154919 RepID=UPI0033CB9A9C
MRHFLIDLEIPPHMTTISPSEGARQPHGLPSQSINLIIEQGQMSFAVLYAFCALSIADRLRESSASTSELALWCQATLHAPQLRSDHLSRLLRAAYAQGWIDQLQDGAWSLTHSGRDLCLTAPQSWAERVSKVSATPWAEVGHRIGAAILTGTGAQGHERNALFGWRDEVAPDVADALVADMGRRSSAAAELLALRDMRHVLKVIDVGGQGSMLSALLDGHLHLQGVVLNPRLTAEAEGRLHHEDMVSRWKEEKVDLVREGVPKSYKPLYLLDGVLCQLGDTQAVTLLCRIVNGMKGFAAAEIVLVEPLLAEQPTSHGGVIADLILMALTPAGRVRTLAENKKLLQDAGWPHIEHVPFNDEQGLIIARLPAPARPGSAQTNA